MEQRLIDANNLKSHYVGTELDTDLEVFLKPTVENAPTVFTIPENPTNGDILKAVFPEIFIQPCRLVDDVGYYNFEGHGWWDAQYKEAYKKEVGK